jgi:hypothetical protein
MTVTTCLLVVQIVLGILVLIGEIVNVVAFDGNLENMAIDDEGNIIDPMAMGVLVVSGFIGLMMLPAFVATAIAFCMFINRANKNVRALGAVGMEFTPGWAVGWFFIPLANLWKPFQAVREIYQASDPNADAVNWKLTPTAPLLGWWWAMWLLSNFVGQIELRMTLSAPEGLAKTTLVIAIVGSVLNLLSAMLAISLVRAIHARQELKAGKTFPNLKTL